MDWRFNDYHPIWLQIAEYLTFGILCGEYPPGSRFPGIRELAAQAGVNPNTMQRAVARLEADGLLVSGRTAGRTVTEDTAVIEMAVRSRAKAAVDECRRILAALGCSEKEIVLMIGGASSDDESNRH